MNRLQPSAAFVPPFCLEDRNTEIDGGFKTERAKFSARLFVKFYDKALGLLAASAKLDAPRDQGCIGPCQHF